MGCTPVLSTGNVVAEVDFAPVNVEGIERISPFDLATWAFARVRDPRERLQVYAHDDSPELQQPRQGGTKSAKARSTVAASTIARNSARKSSTSAAIHKFPTASMATPSSGGMASTTGAPLPNTDRVHLE